MRETPSDFGGNIDYIKKRIGELSDDALVKFANSDDHEDVVFNVVRGFCEKIKTGVIFDCEILEKVFTLAEARMEYLKTKFAGKSVGRDAEGKIEYDTTLDALRELRKLIADNE